MTRPGHVTAVLTSDKLLIKLFNLKVHLSTVDVKNEKQRQKNLLIFFSPLNFNYHDICDLYKAFFKLKVRQLTKLQS